VKKEVLMEYARKIASIRIRMEMEDGAYEAVADGIERGIREVMLKAAYRLKSVEDFPMTGKTISGAIRDIGVQIPRYPYVRKLAPDIKRAIVPSTEQVMQHIILKDALELLSEFVIDIEAAMLEEAERLAREMHQEKVTTKHIEKACDQLGKWLGC